MRETKGLAGADSGFRPRRPRPEGRSLEEEPKGLPVDGRHHLHREQGNGPEERLKVLIIKDFAGRRLGGYEVWFTGDRLDDPQVQRFAGRRNVEPVLAFNLEEGGDVALWVSRGPPVAGIT